MAEVNSGGGGGHGIGAAAAASARQAEISRTDGDSAVVIHCARWR